MHSDGKDLGWRVALNQRDGNPTGARHYSTLLAAYGGANFNFALAFTRPTRPTLDTLPT